ncbi:MAG: DUF255 domain-containing protein [Candidatus Hydrogenedens sp.]|nr:DUF255 domain-containing protein [Candidatus Hydrogenedens sp.]
MHINALIHETSPYLLQHAHNPVDWHPWGEEALDLAKERDVPILVSIGYSACHWCHVMEHESFEDDATALYMNAHFVCIKVDREERPDLDDIYMQAVVALTGQGGWPLNVFLTPDLRPFYGGTYFPPDGRYGRPSWGTILQGVNDAWTNRRDEVMTGAAGLTAHLTERLTAGGGAGDALPAQSVIDRATAQLKKDFDADHGGWGGAPKFPSGMTIGLLLREYQRTGDAELLHMATRTLDDMAAGGIYDHLGGGFARYSVDDAWLVPHFEKMLYDNAQLSQAYLEAYQLTGEARYARVAREIFTYVLRDMTGPHGAFYSAEDADSEGEEGKFYLWTEEEILSLLGEEDGALFNRYYAVAPYGNFSSHEPYHHGQNILHTPRPLALAAEKEGMTPEAFEAKLADLRVHLLDARSQRVRPGLDDKVLSSWNGLMVSSLAFGGRVLGEPAYIEAAAKAAGFFLDQMFEGDTLLRTHREGQSRLPGYLDDYAFLANAFADLYEATFDPAWLGQAKRLADQMIAHFWDEEQHSFYFTGGEHKHLIIRTKPSYDGAEPSGNSVAALALLRLSKLTGEEDYRAKARGVLAAMRPMLEQAPRGYLKLMWALHWELNPPREFALAGATPEDTRAAADALFHHFAPNKVVAAGSAEGVPLLEGKAPPESGVAVYVCQDYVCAQPLQGADVFAAWLDTEYPRFAR